MISATQRGGQLERGIHVLAFEHQTGNTLPERRDFCLAHPRTGNDARAEARLRQRNDSRRVFFDLLLVLVFGGQRFHFACRAGDLIYGVHHGLVVVCHGEVVLRLGDIQVRIQATAVKDRQRQPGGHAHLLRGRAEQVAQVQRILL